MTYEYIVTENNNDLLSVGVSHKKTEDYVNFVGDLMYPKKKFGTFGYNLAKLKVILLLIIFMSIKEIVFVLIQSVTFTI
jgi:hypothetical protein